MPTSPLRDPADLHGLLNYRLTRLLSASSVPVIRLCEGGHGVSRREWRLIALLALQGEMSPSALADEADLDRARTSRAITQLAAKRLVERRALPGDRRQARVRLSDEGRRLYDALLPQVAALNRALVSVLDDAELAVLDDLLARLSAQARRLRDAPSGARADRHRGGSRRHWDDED
ncbi:MarR family winged helix-turn-helix transcriptional regulator [Aquabacterium sp. J223]|uniref:MarR family winged helix-turn-helix transcriptional regulator n=1 Tax=Aquabacterium sp. J223 TaxID=2898431 RepID=UPI0021AD71DE|nr:MarR family transcriptional regulator [Aquabacterium sp. J223]UUX94814.1 MarR family transcriptional regulator [Aquabacterium sp. J223]